jgi:hypothetical protein
MTPSSISVHYPVLIIACILICIEIETNVDFVRCVDTTSSYCYYKLECTLARGIRSMVRLIILTVVRPVNVTPRKGDRKLHLITGGVSAHRFHRTSPSGKKYLYPVNLMYWQPSKKPTPSQEIGLVNSVGSGIPRRLLMYCAFLGRPVSARSRLTEETDSKCFVQRPPNNAGEFRAPTEIVNKALKNYLYSYINQYRLRRNCRSQ